MKYIALRSFKELVLKFCKELEKGAIKYVESKDFKNSGYNDYTADQLLDAARDEDNEAKRAVIVCLFHYKMMDRFYQTREEKEHFKRFKGE